MCNFIVVFISLTALSFQIAGCVSEQRSLSFEFYFVKVNVLVACV
jgi:hypothetical protein